MIDSNTQTPELRSEQTTDQSADCPPIQITELTKRFDTLKVLRSCSLTVPRGSVVGLLGKNGQGKTTLIKCLLGLLRPQAGSAKVYGEKAWDLSPAVKARLGYVAQQPEFYPWMKVRDLIDYTAAFYPHWNDELVKKMVDAQQLPLGRRVRPFSEGQKQKLAIILAMGHEPDLLILDEPVASLDPAARREFLKTLLEMVAQGDRTILFSTHITSDVERIADRVAILNDGYITVHEELGDLKDRFKRLRLSADHDLPTDLNIPGQLRCQVTGNTALASTDQYTDALPDQLQQQHNCRVDVEDLNLEEIFLEVHRV